MQSVCDDGFICVETVKIAKDGNCLFSSIAHQLFAHDINSVMLKKSTIELRASVVNYIQNHFVDFEHELKGSVYDVRELEDEKYIELHKIESIDEASKCFLNNYLNRPGIWGGSESLKAITYIHNVNIVIFNENGPVLLVHNSQEQSQRTITVAFRYPTHVNDANQLRNHYDSVCNISSDDIYKTAKVISNKVSQRLDTSLFLSDSF